ncbi:MAG: hypothetical protein GF405_04745 [Candidatus Eisenbacteria bacterium]|nr:hypothetical protein [Candidatus Eisenbacteria bacterium]
MRVSRRLMAVCAAYILCAGLFGSMNLSGDERAFVREPYQLLGGDYTRAYLSRGDIRAALGVMARAYFMYWYYRPMFSPIIEERHLDLFQEEEQEFGYEITSGATESDEATLDRYADWMVVPEPNRWYYHGAGKPLLPAVATIPPLLLVELIGRGEPSLLELQFGRNYHPIFILTRMSHFLAGLVSLLLVYDLLHRRFGEERALLGAALFALFPATIRYFPNIHHDAIMIPFLVLTVWSLARSHYLLGGLAYGLALASKNTALLLVPSLALVLAHRLFCIWRSGGRQVLLREIGLWAKRGALFLLLAFFALLPFANPLSYAREVLTPMTQRAFDPRGEDVAAFSVEAKLEEPRDLDENRSRRRPEVMLLTRMDFLSVGLLFILIATVLVAPRLRSDLLRLSFIVLLLTLPYQVIFERGLTYRYLLFLPFFVFVLAGLGTRRQLVWVLVFLAAIDVVLLIDPITATPAHILQTGNTLWEALLPG